MPRISAATVAQNREQRRAALLGAAATLTLRSGTFTVAEVASEIGLSRSAFYEYYDSAADLVADVLVDELDRWHADLVAATAVEGSPRGRVRAWITAVLAYVGDGRHALVRAAGAVDLPEGRREEVRRRHRALMHPLGEALADLGVPDAAPAAELAWGAVDAAIRLVEGGATTADAVTPAVIAFVDAGVDALLAPG